MWCCRHQPAAWRSYMRPCRSLLPSYRMRPRPSGQPELRSAICAARIADYDRRSGTASGASGCNGAYPDRSSETPATREQAIESRSIAVTHISSFRIPVRTNRNRQVFSGLCFQQSDATDDLFDKLDGAANHGRAGARAQTVGARDPTPNSVNRRAPRLTRRQFDRDGTTMLWAPDHGDTSRNRHISV